MSEAQLDEARRLLSAGQFEACARAAVTAAQENPDRAEAHFLLGMALAEGGRIQAGLQALERATVLAPANAEYLAQQAKLLTLARQEAAARHAAEKAVLAAGHADALTLDTIGCVFARLQDHAAALPLFRRAVEAAPDKAEFRFNLATSLGFFGEVDAAEEQYEALLKLRPADGRAHLALAGLRRATPARSHVARLEQALELADDPVEKLRIHYAAAKELQDLGEPARAFRHLETGNRAHKQRIGYDFSADRQIVDALKKGFSTHGWFQGESPVTDAPIFVVGLPRTGTTLVDRIISSHPRVSSAGELQAMPLALKRRANTPSRLVLDVETIEASGALEPAAIGADYLARARQHAGADSPIFTDKLPLNFLYIGHIARALPNARIVCLRRNPMDSIWSNLKHLFATTSSFYAWSYDQEDTARYWLLFDELMAFWQQQFPGRVLELGYEALVADQEGETRRLLSHCGLPWDEACLNFHRNEAPVSTPSAQQVRAPLYSHAVEQWRPYEAQLEPARAILRAAGLSV